MKTEHAGARLLSACGRFLTVACLCLLISCASSSAFRNGETALKNQNWDVAVAEYSRAMAQDPNNAEIKLKLGMAKMFAARAHYEEAVKMEESGKIQQAIMELEVSADLDPDNQATARELELSLIHI